MSALFFLLAMVSLFSGLIVGIVMMFKPGKRWLSFPIIIAGFVGTGVFGSMSMEREAKDEGFENTAAYHADRDAKKAAEDAEEKAAEAAKLAKEREFGHHCLSGWDGVHPDFERQVVEQLRDPDSYETIETRTTKTKDGKNGIIMRYRARNGFGGMNMTEAVGVIDNDTCKATVISFG